MGYKMNGAPMMANTKSHGTNANFKKSGMTNPDGSPAGPPFLKGLGQMAGNFIKGKGPMGFMNPVGMLANKVGLFGRNKGGGNPNANQNTNQQVDQSVANTGVNTDVPVDTVDTNAPLGSEGTMVPNQEELGTN